MAQLVLNSALQHETFCQICFDGTIYSIYLSVYLSDRVFLVSMMDFSHWWRKMKPTNVEKREKRACFLPQRFK